MKSTVPVCTPDCHGVAACVAVGCSVRTNSPYVCTRMYCTSESVSVLSLLSLSNCLDHLGSGSGKGGGEGTRSLVTRIYNVTNNYQLLPRQLQ